MATSAITKLPLVLLVCIAILASSVTARPTIVAAATPTSEDFSLFPCISFVPKATKCVIDVLKNAVAPHPSCCEAISQLHDCSSQFLKDIPSSDMILVKSICASWGVSIS
ncbi:hypothetical protein E5676_scaffold367G00210 [Cucumis melo var. makuwa]|uniref:Uncharacterized protein n=1 Tax=Cucumis melo var. makuwa TaxID=1194695 RepID=A0A5D3CFS6_CUCMM|nr:hypothetical protein E5676_scaffold367G00210 [Cucumis melo var. makuwa]